MTELVAEPPTSARRSPPPAASASWQRSLALPAMLSAGLFAAVLAACGWALLAWDKSTVLAVICFALGPLAVLASGLDRRGRRYQVHAGVLVAESGVLVRQRTELSLRQVRAVATRVGPLQRLCGCGDVLVVAPGTGHLHGGMIVSHADRDRLWLHDIGVHQTLAEQLRLDSAAATDS